jgi:hypothetical protein
MPDGFNVDEIEEASAAGHRYRPDGVFLGC